MVNLSAGKRAHLYALLSWNGYGKQQGEELVEKTPYADLNGITYAETSITQAVKGIREVFGITVTPDSMSAGKIAPTPENYDKVIEILVGIHNKWVFEKASKYDRGSEGKTNGNLFQHLPTALIGLDEVAKDLLFLAPFLEDMGLDIGEMDLVPYGSFKPNSKLGEAYQRYVRKYKADNNIETQEDLTQHIDDCIEGAYEPLVPMDEVGVQRVAYMKFHEDILTDEVCQKNEAEFGGLPVENN